MNVNEKYQEIDRSIKRGLALGNFDGIHMGHQKLIASLLKGCRSKDLEACVYTFMNHTIPVIKAQGCMQYITNTYIKKKLFEATGIDRLFLDTFNEKIMAFSPREFVENILVNTFNCKLAVVGFDYRFGYKAQGDVKLLEKMGKEYGFEVEVIDAVTLEGEKVSSSSIRNYLKEGNIGKVNELLTRPFSLYNQVIHGDGRGAKLGYPTANIYADPLQALPKEGVYATLVKVEERIYKGATFIGTKPTFGENSPTIETFIIDHHRDLYDKFIEVLFITRIRGEVKFNTPEDLINQINDDVNKIKTCLQLDLSVLK